MNTIELKELKEFHSKEKLSNTRKSSITKESQLKEQLLITMQLRLKSNISQKKLKKLSSNTSQLKELGKEFNIYQLKHKLFTIPKEKNMLLAKEDNTSRVESPLSDQLEMLEP